MALRAVISRRILSISRFSSQSTAAAAASTDCSSAHTSSLSSNDDEQKPAPIPSTTLFVSGLNKRTTSEILGEAFSKFGEVEQARVVTDRDSGFSKGFGFVRYATLEEAEKGMKGMDAQNKQSLELPQDIHLPHIITNLIDDKFPYGANSDS